MFVTNITQLLCTAFAVEQLLRRCIINRKVAGSIPDGVEPISRTFVSKVIDINYVTFLSLPVLYLGGAR
jgi:hypothetical protein